MPTIHLVRHATPDWPLMHDMGWHGPAVDLVPLASIGHDQAERAAQQLAECEATVIVSSPMTRSLQTAIAIGRRHTVPIVVEFNLREWMPRTDLAWRGIDEVQAAYRDMTSSRNKEMPVEPFAWEPLHEVRRRTLAVLRRHLHDGPVIAVCHQVVIYALTGHEKTAPGTVRSIGLE